MHGFDSNSRFYNLILGKWYHCRNIIYHCCTIISIYHFLVTVTKGTCVKMYNLRNGCQRKERRRLNMTQTSKSIVLETKVLGKELRSRWRKEIHSSKKFFKVFLTLSILNVFIVSYRARVGSFPKREKYIRGCSRNNNVQWMPFIKFLSCDYGTRSVPLFRVFYCSRSR